MSHTETRIKVQFPAAERWTVTGGKKSKCVFLYARAKYEPPVGLRLRTSAPPAGAGWGQRWSRGYNVASAPSERLVSQAGCVTSVRSNRDK